MPISRYFKGHGEEVMRDMKARHGEEEGERVFYATANKNKSQKPKEGDKGRDRGARRRRAAHAFLRGARMA